MYGRPYVSCRSARSLDRLDLSRLVPVQQTRKISANTSLFTVLLHLSRRKPSRISQSSPSTYLLIIHNQIYLVWCHTKRGRCKHSSTQVNHSTTYDDSFSSQTKFKSYARFLLKPTGYLMNQQFNL